MAQQVLLQAGEVSGKVTVAGSSSVTPVMEKLAEAYKAINPNVEIEVQCQTQQQVLHQLLKDICDIGMAQERLKKKKQLRVLQVRL